MPVIEEFEQDRATGLTCCSFESLGPFRASMARNGEWLVQRAFSEVARLMG